MTTNRPYLSIVIPAFNEENRLGATLDRVTTYLKAQSYTSEIIVVDDGSRDKTIEKAKQFLGVKTLPLPQNEGKGHAIKQGMLAAQGNIILYSDADLSTPIEEASRFLNTHALGADIVIGSRALKESNIAVRQPIVRQTMGKVFNLFVQGFVMKGIKDTQCGFKSFTSEAAKHIFSETKIKRFSFDVEALYLARLHGYTIHELPITWRNNLQTSVNPITDSWNMFCDLLHIRSIHQRTN